MMKKCLMILAAFAAIEAGAITATKEYVDRKDAAIVSNVYTKTETDARIIELAPRTDLTPATNYTDAAIGAFADTGTVARASTADSSGYAYQAETAGTALDAEYAAQLANRETGVSRTAAQIFAKLDAATTTNDVCNIVTNEVVVWEVCTNGVKMQGVWIEIYATGEADSEGNTHFFDIRTEDFVLFEMPCTLAYLENVKSIQGLFENVAAEELYGKEFVAERITRNALGLARQSDIPTNTVTKAELESAKSNLATKAEVEAVEDAQESFLRDLETESNRVNNVSASVNVLWSHVYGNSVWIAVTNYLRTIEGVVPSFQLWEVRDGATNCVYSSAEEITNLTAKLIKDGVAAATNGMPSKAWSKYQSGSGAENPQPGAVTIVSTPNIMLTGGGEWHKCIETDNSSVWVLKSNGLCTFGGDTNGYFRITDDEGNAQFEVVKTASYEVDAIASDTEFDESDNFTVTYNSNMANPPTLYAAANLDDPFVGEDASHNINSLGITVSWAKNGSGYWVATVHQDSRLPRLFIHAKVLQEGQNAIRNTAPTLLDGGLIIGGVKYTIVPYTTGGKTYLTLEAMQ